MSGRFASAAVIGTGMMGPGIAVTLAGGGVRATILSRSHEGAAKGLDTARRQIDLLEQHQLMQPGRAAWARDHIASSAALDDVVPGVDLVIESAPEDMRFKQELFAHLDAIAKPGAVLASNTSGLSITSIAERCRRPERVLTTHFWNPPHLMPLVEIIRGEKTADDVAHETRELLAACGKVPVVVKKDRPGQLGNRLQYALVREAMNIVQEGIADADQVDLAAKSGFGLRLPVYGIFEHQDIVGLDMCRSVAEYVMPDLYSERKPPRVLQELVDGGKLGARTGQGFLDWSEKSADEVKRRRDEFILEFIKSQKARA